VCAETGLHRTAVYKWTWPREKGGTDGIIPMRYVPHLLAFAARSGVSLSAQDFVPALPAPSLASSVC